MYKYSQLVVITSERPLTQESQMKEAVRLLQERLKREYGCPLIRNAIARLDEGKQNEIEHSAN